MTTIRRRALAAGLLTLLLAGCASPAGGPIPTPDPTSTVTPDPTPVADEPDDYDPRCDAAYGVPTAAPERLLQVRPLGWPPTPPWASLCLIESPSEAEEIGHFATDPGTKFDDVLWYYEHAFEAGAHGYANVPGEKILTGTLGYASYYLQQGEGFDRYFIYWAYDGEYDLED